jgi:hypothetical protein
MVNMKLINVSNTTLSLNGRKRHRKFDAKQTKRHDFGTEVCAVCDKVFTKYYPRTKVCSEECKREKENARKRSYYKENPAKFIARTSKYYEENREKIKANYEEKSKDPEWVEEINAKQRKYYEENSAKVLARQRNDREENREKYNAKQRARYHAKKEK